MDTTVETLGVVTRSEIYQQPELWLTTLERVPEDCLSQLQPRNPVITTGAGTSAYAAAAAAASWKNSLPVPSTDLLIDGSRFFTDEGLLVSFARSGDSPESAGVVKKVQRDFPGVKHLAITCNANGALANTPGVNAILLDPRTNDRSLVMTSSFSNLVLAGIALNHRGALLGALPSISRRVASLLPELDQKAQAVAERVVSRVVVLASPDFVAAAREASLKILEMTAGNVVAIPETYLGLRHGPMSFLRKDTLVLCLLSSDPRTRQYEADLLQELKRKELGYIVAIAPEGVRTDAIDELIPASAGDLPDSQRTPFEIVFPQLLGYHLSLQMSLNPDNPSPGAVITRVVQGVRIHEQ